MDTNILIHYFEGEIAARRIVENNSITISVITEMELLGYPKLSNSERDIILKFLESLNICGLSQEIKNKAIEIRYSKKLKLPDSNILATSVVKGLPLITADQQLAALKGFEIINFSE
ncbi:MAG: type II toxin-antitoxin system VapC family toxin [Leeuwenhoekiella sp.]